MVILFSGCNNDKEETGEAPGVNVVIDSTFYAMNPMDLDFDSLELVMIDSGMADLNNETGAKNIRARHVAILSICRLLNSPCSSHKGLIQSPPMLLSLL